MGLSCVERLSSDTAAFVSVRIFWDLVACSDRLWEGVKRGSWTPLWPHVFLGRAYSTPSSCQAGCTAFRGWANGRNSACLAVTWSATLDSWPRRGGPSGSGQPFRPDSAPLPYTTALGTLLYQPLTNPHQKGNNTRASLCEEEQTWALKPQAWAGLGPPVRDTSMHALKQQGQLSQRVGAHRAGSTLPQLLSTPMVTMET